MRIDQPRQMPNKYARITDDPDTGEQAALIRVPSGTARSDDH